MIGPYLLECRLGTGGMGDVWRAWDERLKRPVAIKQVRPDLSDQPGVRQRLRHEAAAAARLNHPAIVHIYDILEADDTDWIVMELVEGETLAKILAAGPLDLQQAVRLGREIAKGLAKAHSHEIVHRDLKALNVMVTSSGHAKILDFGVAKLAGLPGGGSGESTGSSQSHGSILIGTPYAMSPEQIRGAPLDPRSDLFSFGSLLYEMLTGLSPFQADGTEETLSRVCSYRQIPVRQLVPEAPPELSELVDWLLEKDARHRPSSALEVAAVLNTILARQSTGVLTESRGTPPPAWEPADRRLGRTVSLTPRPVEKSRWTSGLATAGERRQVTVVCCALVEVSSPGTWWSVELEDLPKVLPELRRLLYEVVTRFEGSAGTALGHHLWIYFGYPQAQGDDAERAVRTACELVARARQAGWASGRGFPLALRVGVHSGPAIVSKDREQPEPLALGSTLDLATDLQSLAPAGEVLVSGATRQLIARSFEMEELPAVRFSSRYPDMGESVPVFRILTPLDVSEQGLRASAPLIAREMEVGMLVQLWELVLAGESQVVLISGEGGIGKSRLVHGLREELGPLAPRWLLCYGVAHARNSPFFSVIELLRRDWLASARSPAEELAILEGLLREHGLPVADDLPILALLLSLPLPPGTVPPPQSPDARRRRTLEALLHLFIQATAEQPVIFVVEDLHWLDPSSLELIGALLEVIGASSLLMILTFRQEFGLPWGHRASWLQLHLSRLSDADTLQLIAQIPGGKRLPPDLQQQIVAKSDGVPLFVEELTRSCVEAGEASGVRGIPGLLRDSLTARLDRLGRAREVAQLAAVIGRTFSFELLAAVSPLDRIALRQDLELLVHADLLHRRGGQGSGEGATYLFKHVLLQEAACELLLPGDLERLHHRVAEVLMADFPAIAASQPERVAHHYTLANEPERAIDHWLRAGQRALERFASLEALEHFRNGLSLIPSLPRGPDRDHFELSLQIGSAQAVIVARGHSGGEVETLFDRALTLSGRLGEVPSQFQALLWSFYTWRGDLSVAWSLAIQGLRTAKARQDSAGLILGFQELAKLQACLGRPRSALRALRHALALCPAGGGRDSELSLLSGWDTKSHILCETAPILCDVGFPDQALRFVRQGLELVESRADPYGTALACQSLSWIHLARREHEEASLCAQRMRDLCLRHGFTFFAIHGRFLTSLASARLAPAEEAVDRIGEAIQALDALRRDHRQELNLPQMLGWLAEACLACGMDSEARGLLEEAFQISLLTRERLGNAELFRLEGALLLAAGNGEPRARQQAEVRLLNALDEARAAGSLWLELRAATDLGRLWSEEGRGKEAKGLVAGVVSRFEEGWETADLKAATALLAGMG